MKTTTKLRVLISSFFMLILFVGCKNEAKTEGSSTSSTTTTEETKKQGQAFIEDDGSTPNVLQIAIGSPDHTTLVAAVQAADLENALVNAGPLMV
ncbi:MAG: fasciclin domain-containing protein, partial [Maribacter sp.]|nr:fasciclin domain-containing protein [Maribacter sp.]